MSTLVISLDFELFWGQIGYSTIYEYGANVEGVWSAVPGMLALFKKYDVHVTWATVGMLMCKDFKQWSDLRPLILPTYDDGRYSAYSISELVREYPKFFFAPPLIEQILTVKGQELASHTYSHFSCARAGATVGQFEADLKCAQIVFAEYGIKPTSLVFPLNQVRDEYLSVLSSFGFRAYRGNPGHWVYRDGHFVPWGILGRLIRVMDAYLPLTGNHVSRMPNNVPARPLINIPASRFLRPVTGNPFLNIIQLQRVKAGMQEAASVNGIFHLWWHPHNFGINLKQNLVILEEILQYYSMLRDEYGMRSLTMAEVAEVGTKGA